jgi:flagellar FliJ protein
MAEKFHFKLGGLLKLREFKEKRLMAELGAITQELGKISAEIESSNQYIQESYNAHTQAANRGLSVRSLSLYPGLVQGSRQRIEALENEKAAVERRYRDKIQELKMAMGDTRVIEGLKEKNHQEWKKMQNKKENEKIEDSILSRRAYAGRLEE